jgi:hypothetical protein
MPQGRLFVFERETLGVQFYIFRYVSDLLIEEIKLDIQLPIVIIPVFPIIPKVSTALKPQKEKKSTKVTQKGIEPDKEPSQYIYQFVEARTFELMEVTQLTINGRSNNQPFSDAFIPENLESNEVGELKAIPPTDNDITWTFAYEISEAELKNLTAEPGDVTLQVGIYKYSPITAPSLSNGIYTFVFQEDTKEWIREKSGEVKLEVFILNQVVKTSYVKIPEVETEDDIDLRLKEELLTTIPTIDNNLRRLSSEDRVQSVKLAPPSIDPTDDEALWKAIRKSKFNFLNYQYFINDILQLEDDRIGPKTRDKQRNAIRNYVSPFQNIASYQYLKQATDLYMLLNGYFFQEEYGDRSVIRTYEGELMSLNPDQMTELYDSKFLRSVSRSVRANFPSAYQMFGKNELGKEISPAIRNNNQPWGRYFYQTIQSSGGIEKIDPSDDFKKALTEDDPSLGFDWYNLSQPMYELIWSYWMEELGLVQTMNAISLRFQNVKKRQGPDPLANFALDSLRPLGNLLWGYVEDERFRTTMVRRCYSYDDNYGISLRGKAVPVLSSVESRSRFIGAFHQLLKMANDYYQQSNFLTVKPDAFPLLNQLKEVHIILREGQHNQFRDLTWATRVEMLTQQWILDREEVKEFIRGRYMVPYEEGWMGTVDTMKRLQNWNDTSVSHFYHLATNGEQLLLSIRYGDWANPDYRAENAATWAHFWRDEIQRYLHAYRAVTSVDLSADLVETRPSPTVEADRYLPPAHHLERREMGQNNRRDDYRGQMSPPVFSRNGRR